MDKAPVPSTGGSTVARTGFVDPIPTTPRRRGGSIRRTSHIDMLPTAADGLQLRGAARDLLTAGDGGVGGGGSVGGGRGEVVDEAWLTAELDPARHVTAVATSAPAELTATLVGRQAGPGFRAAVDAAVPLERTGSTPLYLLLDDLPVAALISGYAQLYSGALDDRQIDASALKADICAGWHSDGTMIVSLRTTGTMPVPHGPPANDLVPPDDPLAWHPLDPLPAGAMRRQRLVEVAGGEPLAVYAMFRDTHADDQGTVTILHEYSLTAALDPASLVIRRCEARPQTLPWTECPAAAASAGRLDGHPAGEVRQLVREEFRGTSTCTHLNDLLRSLADLTALAPRLTASIRPSGDQP